MAQTFRDREVIVIDDGSDPEQAEQYRRLQREFEGQVRFILLPHTGIGLGHAITRNIAIAHSQGEYVGFLDDDDSWTDPEFLQRAALVLTENGDVDFYMADQEAFQGSERLPPGIWIEALSKHTSRFRPAGHEAFFVTKPDLFRYCDGFCHLNTLLAKRSLLNAVGGFHAGLRYEPDRDLFLRAVDRATRIVYCPRVVARHNVPDRSKSVNASTRTTPLEKALIQLDILNRASAFCRDVDVVSYANRHKVYTVKKISELLYRSGDLPRALAFAREAMMLRLSWKWTGFTLWLLLRRSLSRGRSLP